MESLGVDGRICPGTLPELSADRLALLEEHWTIVREVAGSNPGRPDQRSRSF